MVQVATLEAIEKIKKDVREAAVGSSKEARFLVDAYYSIQQFRIEAQNQVRALGESEEPNAVMLWLFDQQTSMENELKKVLDLYSNTQIPGIWSKSILGIGPVLSAGLLAHFDVMKAPTAGQFWRFAGLDPSITWNKGEKRPWNAALKTLIWKCGQSFIKVSNNEKDYYGKVYKARRVIEIRKNEEGLFADQAVDILTKKKIGKDTEAYAWYSGSLTPEQSREIYESPAEKRQGLSKRLAGEPGSGTPMLPPAHIVARAQRVAVHLFVSHYHHVCYVDMFGIDPPKPYVLAHLDHVDYIPPPNWPLTTEQLKKFTGTRRTEFPPLPWPTPNNK